MLWVYGHYKYFTFTDGGLTLDVYRRQILTTKVDPRTVRVRLYHLICFAGEHVTEPVHESFLRESFDVRAGDIWNAESCRGGKNGSNQCGRVRFTFDSKKEIKVIKNDYIAIDCWMLN